jgi:hypothetical protein
MLTREEFEEWLSRVWTFSRVTPAVLDELLAHDAALRERSADLLEALEAIASSTYLDADPPELRAQNENVHRMALQAIARAEGGRSGAAGGGGEQ